VRYKRIMHLRKTILITAAAAVVLAAGCKKDNTTGNSGNTENCIQSTAIAHGNIIEGRYIVAFNSTTINGRTMNQHVLEETGETIMQRNAIDAGAMENAFSGEPGGFIATLTDEEAERLRHDESVKAIEPDRMIALSTCFTVAAPHLLTWNIKRVGYGDGTGKTAWVLDTGIDFEHPDLKVDVARAKSFIANEPTADDQNGHGTHVAGIIGGLNNNFGVLGVASGANVVPIKVLDGNGSGPISAVIQALGWVNTHGAAGDVVNLSLGEDTTSTILNMQVQNTASRGIFITIAAGNDHQPANKFSPGNTNGTNIYTVSAIDSLDNFANFSNYGNDVVDYAAPGVRILSTYHNNRYAYMSGTSMAAPHMAGLLLLRGRSFTTSGTARNDPDGNADLIAHY
jgi:subtilisin